jgi:hypothetical protein
MVSVLGPLFRTAGHIVRTQHGVTASAGQRRGDVEIRNYLRDQAGSWSLVFDLSIAHDRFGSSSHVQQNGCLSHTQDRDAPLRVAAQRWMLKKLPSNTHTLISLNRFLGPVDDSVTTDTKSQSHKVTHTQQRFLGRFSVRSLPISNNTLTIRTFLFSPRSLVPPPACMASFCVFFFYRPTGRLRHTSLPLEFHRKPTTRKHSGSSARHSTTA